MHRTKVKVAEDALDANQTIAHANRDDFDRAGRRGRQPDERPGRRQDDAARGRRSPTSTASASGVLEGDVQGSMDADRIAGLHIPVVQLNTDSGFGGECHLDANMVRSALADLPLDELDLLVIENVGNLVCPAEFRVGEDARVMICSVTEGEDKPLKYPLMFRACELVVVNKIDLLPHLDFDLDRLLANIDAVNPGARVIADQRPHRRGRRGVARVARRRPRAGRGGGLSRRRALTRTATADALALRIDELLEARRDPGEPRVLRGRGRAARALLPPDGRALRPRRAAGRARALARRRAPTPATSRSSSSTR